VVPIRYQMEENVVVSALGGPWGVHGWGFGQLWWRDWYFRSGTRERKVQLPQVNRKSGWQQVVSSVHSLRRLSWANRIRQFRSTAQLKRWQTDQPFRITGTMWLRGMQRGASTWKSAWPMDTTASRMR
jgi:hypothetical protein